MANKYPLMTNPYYLCYCRAAGEMNPDKRLRLDKAKGASMLGFITFIADEKSQFYAAHPEAFLAGDRYTIYDLAAWDRWLMTRYPEAK